MIAWPRSVPVYAHRRPVDMRKSFDTLGAVVSASMPRTLLSAWISGGSGGARSRTLPRGGSTPIPGFIMSFCRLDGLLCDFSAIGPPFPHRRRRTGLDVS